MRKRLLLESNIHILRKIGFSPKKIEEQAISEIVLFILIVVLLAYCVGYQLGANSEVSKGWEVLISLVCALCGYDMVKEVIASTVQAVSAKKFDDGKEEGLKNLKRELEEIHMYYKDKTEESVDEQRHRYYLSRIFNGTESFEISDLKLNSLSQNVRQEIHSLGAKSFQEDLEQEFKEIRIKRFIRCSIQKLPDQEFLQPIALVSAMYALEKSKEEMNSPPEYYLFRDIYAYLKAWLICSIDNDNGELMPISLIGLNYPNQSNPNKEIYKVALNYIKNELLEKSKSKEILPERTRQSIKEHITKLIELIEIYPASN